MSRSKTRRRTSRNARFALPGFDFKKSFAFGGSGGSVTKNANGAVRRVRTSNPKTARYIDPKGFLHLVLRSTLAIGERSFLMRDRTIRKILYDQAASTGVTIRSFANAGNHLHLIVSPHSRRAFKRFIRASTGLIARKTLGAERNSPWRNSSPADISTSSSRRSTATTAQSLDSTPSTARFWDARPFTRIVRWGRDYLGLKNYLELNRIEVALGLDRDSARSMLVELEKRARLSGLAAGFG